MVFKIEISDVATFRALYEALAQYCDNERDYVDSQDGLVDADVVNKLRKAEALLERMDLHRILTR